VHLMCARTGLAPAARRFWRWLECGTALMGLGFLVAGASLLARPIPLDATPQFPAYVIVLLLAGLAVYMLALLWMPVGARDRLDRIRLTIDGVTAILGGGAMLWYFAVHPILLRHPTGTAMSIVSIFGSCLPAACLATKIVLDNGGPIDR